MKMNDVIFYGRLQSEIRRFDRVHRQERLLNIYNVRVNLGALEESEKARYTCSIV